jgi:hypothetical protein
MGGTPALPDADAPMKRVLQRAVLRTRGLPGFRALYKGIYAGAVAGSARALHALPGMESVYLHRGMSRAGWEPGLSDIDLVLVRAESLPGGDESEFLSRLAARAAGLRRWFPMLGDLWLGSPPELRDYRRWGGLRAWEDVPHWKLLAGRAADFPALAESEAKRRWLDPWVWLFINHMEICRRVFGGGESPERADAQIRKLSLDVRRYSDFIMSAGEPLLSREQAKERASDLAGMSARELWLDSSLRLARASRRVLSQVATGETASAAFPVSSSESLRRLVSSVGAARGAVTDLPYHTYLLLGDGASPADYERAAEALSAEPQPGVALVLEPAAWALLLQSSYLGAPLGWLASGGGAPSARGETVFPGWGASACGETPERIPLLSERLRLETAAEAASWMQLWWRSLWIAPGCPNRFVLYHLYTRALGLRLMLAGEAGLPLCDWELLLARAASRFEEESRPSARLRSLLLSEPAAALDSTSRAAVASGHFTAAAGLMDGLRRAVADFSPEESVLPPSA